MQSPSLQSSGESAVHGSCVNLLCGAHCGVGHWGLLLYKECLAPITVISGLRDWFWRNNVLRRRRRQRGQSRDEEHCPLDWNPNWTPTTELYSWTSSRFAKCPSSKTLDPKYRQLFWIPPSQEISILAHSRSIPYACASYDDQFSHLLQNKMSRQQVFLDPILRGVYWCLLNDLLWLLK